ncbi:MAG: translation initiation factor IF-3 [Holosporales bacterium]|jgi:translation initiation factor IF-3|nr:translation initiation factor IF-3 [Holosporales bacterium]
MESCLAKIFTSGRQDLPQQNSPIINENITFREVRLIGAGGEAIGVVTIDEALRAAENVGLDLVLIAAESVPPVCKILDYGKYRYELQKKKTESRKKQKTVSLKEVQVRPFIGENDLLVKCRSIKKFIEAGDKVKLVLRFRGREMNRQEIGQDVVRKVIDYCHEFAKEESPPKLDGAVIIAVLTSK